MSLLGGFGGAATLGSLGSTGGATGINPVTNPSGASSQAKTVAAAAKKYGVPEAVLIGVWGKETDFGRNVSTSTAGAIGDFQFIPSTAAEYGYPLTNNPSAAQFAQQADAAARKLAHDEKTTGSWAGAVTAYGGGYSLQDVLDKAKSYTGGSGPSLASLSGSGVASTINGVQSGLNSVGDLISILTDIHTWIRVGEAIAGLVLIYLALKTLTGGF